MALTNPFAALLVDDNEVPQLQPKKERRPKQVDDRQPAGVTDDELEQAKYAAGENVMIDDGNARKCCQPQ
jgi:hypothetical protein